jgi:hypothetical protein
MRLKQSQVPLLLSGHKVEGDQLARSTRGSLVGNRLVKNLPKPLYLMGGLSLPRRRAPRYARARLAVRQRCATYYSLRGLFRVSASAPIPGRISATTQVSKFPGKSRGHVVGFRCRVGGSRRMLRSPTTVSLFRSSLRTAVAGAGAGAGAGRRRDRATPTNAKAVADEIYIAAGYWNFIRAGLEQKNRLRKIPSLARTLAVRI